MVDTGTERGEENRNRESRRERLGFTPFREVKKIGTERAGEKGWDLRQRAEENRDRKSRRERLGERLGFVRHRSFRNWCLGFTPFVCSICTICSVVAIPLVRGGMVVPVPFRRWVHVKYRNPQTPHQGFYCLLPIRGQRVIAAVARYRHAGQLEYKAYSMFVREYKDVLGLGDNLIWAVRDDLVKWLDALVHNSFVRYSTPDVARCWYIKRMQELLVFAPTMLLPQGLRSSFEGIHRSTWILFRHGSKAWPIQVVDAVMTNGWREFRTTHGIATNYKLILMCEHKWVFNVIIFDQNDVEVSYNWTMLVNEHWRQFHSVRGNVITACSPSTILRNLPLIKSGYWCIPEVNYLEEFQTRLEPVLEDLNLQSISIRMGNRTWTISVHGGYLNAAMFSPFLNALQLQPYDYVFITMLPNLEVRVVILDAGNDRERIYDWL